MGIAGNKNPFLLSCIILFDILQGFLQILPYKFVAVSKGFIDNPVGEMPFPAEIKESPDAAVCGDIR